MYKQKYLKYKQKYLELKQKGGSITQTKTKIALLKAQIDDIKYKIEQAKFDRINPKIEQPNFDRINRKLEQPNFDRINRKLEQPKFDVIKHKIEQPKFDVIKHKIEQAKFEEIKKMKIEITSNQTSDNTYELNDTLLNLKNRNLNTSREMIQNIKLKFNKLILELKPPEIKNIIYSKYSMKPGLFKMLDVLDSDITCIKNSNLHKFVVDDADIDDLFMNEFSVLKIINIYRLIYKLKLLLKQKFTNLENYKPFMNIRYHDNKFYKIPSIHTTSDNYIDLVINIDDYIRTNTVTLTQSDIIEIKQMLMYQESSKDSNHLINDSISIEILKSMINDRMIDSITFQELFLLEYSLKRLVQDKITEYILNYSVVIQDGNYKIYKQNNIYSYFVLKTVKNIEQKITTQKNSIFTKLEDKLEGSIEYKKFIMDQLKQSLDIKIILKGGNLIKFLYDPGLEINNGFSLTNYDNYFKKLSDYDFDIKINFFNPLVLTKFFKDFRLCNNKYLEIYQNIKIIIMNFINEYFTNIKENYNNITDIQYKFEQVENSLICNIECFNKYVKYFSLIHDYDHDNFDFDEIEPLHRSLIYIPFLNIEKNNLEDNWSDSDDCRIALDSLSKNSCELYDETIYRYINCKELPQGNATKESILSYISSQYIGNINKTNKLDVQFFDLTRLCLRFNIMDSGIKSKAECIDFGLFNFGKQDMEKGESKIIKYKFTILGENIEFYGKSIKYLIDELIVLVFSATTKKSKRLVRIFMILDQMIKYNYNIFEIIMSENKFMSNIYFNKIVNTYDESKYNLMSFNLIDSIILLFILNIKLIIENKTELDKTSSFKLFWGAYEFLNEKKESYNPLDRHLKIPFIIKEFSFNSLLTINEFDIILR